MNNGIIMNESTPNLLKNPTATTHMERMRKCIEDCADLEEITNSSLLFFRAFNETFKTPTDTLSPGNRHFFVSNFENALVKVIDQTHIANDLKLSAKSSPRPRIQWKSTAPLTVRKYFDVLVTVPGSQKSIAIEIKGREFDGIAPAMMQIALAIEYGEYLIGSSNGQKTPFPITPHDTMFVVLLGDSGNRDRALFDGMNSLIGNPKNVKFHALFPEHLRHSPKDIRCIANTFFDEVVGFFNS